MNKKTLLAVIISMICMSNIFAGSLGQRFGANSYLTNLPLYYEDGNPKKTANRYNDQITLTNIQQCDTQNICNNIQQVQVSTEKMKAKQAKIDRKKAKLNKRIKQLETQKNELIDVV